MRILVLDDRAPNPRLGAGFPRAHDILRHLHAQGHSGVFIPCVVRDSAERLHAVIPPGFQYKTLPRAEDIAGFVAANAGQFDALWVSRPHNMLMLQHFLGPEHPVWQTWPLVVYDAEAVFALRKALQRHYQPDCEPWLTLEEELDLAKVADVVAVVSKQEEDYFCSRGANTVLLGGSYRMTPSPVPYERRSGLLFVGALRGADTPNVDAVLWFCRHVVPQLRTSLGDAFQLDVVGMIEGVDMTAFSAPDVRFLGEVGDLDPLYARRRLCIAPHRFAAGIAAKILEASSHGVPVVATQLLADQLDWGHDAELFVGTTNAPEAFAAVCVEAYQDAEAWRRVQCGSRQRIQHDYSEAVFREALAGILQTRRR